MLRTIKFGALPIYVSAPMKTAPSEIATRIGECVVVSSAAFPPASSKKTIYVGALEDLMSMGLPPKRTNLLEFALLAGSPNISNESACIIFLLVLACD